VDPFSGSGHPGKGECRPVLVLDAALWIDAAGDFLLTLVKEFQQGAIHRFSPYTSLRGALECDAWACWLLDPDAEDKVRVGRALTLELFPKVVGIIPATPGG